MSCSVVAIPFALNWIIGGLVTQAAIMTAAEQIFEDKGKALKQKLNKENQNIEQDCDDVYVISEKRFLEKSFETPFVDKNLLLKTLEEHGVKNIKENEWGQIKGHSGNFGLTFERSAQDKPYNVIIKYLSTDDVEEKFENLTSEYAINVQEECYNNIVEKLNANNMEIESEEVCDDNSIVITVNLE